MDNQQERLALAAYFAGIVDGEGWIGFTSHRRKFGYANTPIIAVHMVGRDTIEHLKNICDQLELPSYIQHNKDGTSRWMVSGMKRCERVIHAILPWLFVKRVQAELILDFIHSRKNGRYGAPASDYENFIRDSVKALNSKGKNPQRLHAWG